MKQDNPQQAAAYVAGLIDGEGTIRVQHMKAARGRAQYLPQIKMTLTGELGLTALNYLKSLYGGWLRNYQPQSAKGNARRANEWTLQGRVASLRLMRDIQPYCIIKQAHVELMIEFIVAGEESRPPKPVSDTEAQRRKKIFEQFKVLNARGVQLQRLSASASSEDATVRSVGTIQPAEADGNISPPLKGQ